MEAEDTIGMAKRMKPSEEDNGTLLEDGSAVEVLGEEAEPTGTSSEEMEMEIARIHEKINNFTQMVSELLESGKGMLKALSNDFEERLILIHKEQIEKWMEEIKELRVIDAVNEESAAVIHNAQYVFENVHGCGSRLTNFSS